MEVSILFLQNSGSPREVSLKPGINVLGRETGCQLRIPLAEVSRRHCELSIVDSGVLVRDLGSANGTVVNGQRIDEKVLGAGDAVVIGPCRFIVRIDGQPSDADLAEIARRVQVVQPASANDESPEGASSILGDLGPLDEDDSSLIDFDFDLDDDEDDQPAL